MNTKALIKAAQARGGSRTKAAASEHEIAALIGAAKALGRGSTRALGESEFAAKLKAIRARRKRF